jgi:hypothetical protein
VLIPSSLCNETMLMILCPLCPNLHPSLMRRCSRSSTVESTSYPTLQQSRPGSMRRCSQFSSLILRACQVRLTSVSSGCASHSRILLMHPRHVTIAPTSSKCDSHSRVHISSASTTLLQVHPAPPSSPLCPECCLCPLCALLAGGGEKEMEFPLPGPLCEALTAFPSPPTVLCFMQ